MSRASAGALPVPASPFAEFAFPLPRLSNQAGKGLPLAFGWRRCQHCPSFPRLTIVCGSCLSSGHSSCGNKQELQMRGVQHHRSQWISQKPKQQPMCLYREEWNSACSLINDFLKVLTHRKQTLDKYSLNPLKKTKPQTPHLKHNLSCLKASFGFLLMP